VIKEEENKKGNYCLHYAFFMSCYNSIESFEKSAYYVLELTSQVLRIFIEEMALFLASRSEDGVWYERRRSYHSIEETFPVPKEKMVPGMSNTARTRDHTDGEAAPTTTSEK
jgi:hypothetical protein